MPQYNMNKNIARYNLWRFFRPHMLLRRKSFNSTCYAPFVSMLLDTKGYVRACCQSTTHSLGNVTQNSLKEIWQGEVIQGFRQQLIMGELPAGCTTCQWEIDNCNYAHTFARAFDGYKVSSKSPQWPINIWFSLSNSCNLECIQCYGELSSSIRKHREGLPPLKPAYDDRFFDELREFLPHLEQTIFLGGEAFLSRENFRIWDMMIEDKLKPQNFIITNGTIYNNRIERVLEQIPSSISISLDGATRNMVEEVRYKANYDKVLLNIKRFRDYTRDKKTQLMLSFCIMPNNYHEFADFLLLADELDCDASTNTVFHPAQHSLNVLPSNELQQVLETWQLRNTEMRCNLSRNNKKLWIQEVTRLKRWLKRPAKLPKDYYLAPISLGFKKRSVNENNRVQDLEAELEYKCMSVESAQQVLAEWSNDSGIDEATLDQNDVVSCKLKNFAGLARDQIDGLPLSEVLMKLREYYGADVNVINDVNSDYYQDRTLRFFNLDGHATEIRWITIRSKAEPYHVTWLLSQRTGEISSCTSCY